MKGVPAKGGACLAVLLVVLLVVSSIPLASQGDSAQGSEPNGGPVILVVGELDKMRSRNPLPAMADDVWTHDVLDRVYDTVGKLLPEADEIRPYIVKGVDADGNGQFDTDEYGRFAKDSGIDPLNVTAYYDFNGVYFHDSVQANISDLFFSYQLRAMNPRMNDPVRLLMDQAGKSGSNYSTTRWLHVSLVSKVWQNEPSVGDPALRYAVRFRMQEQLFLFYRSTLAGCILFPRHVWEGTGWRVDVTTGWTVFSLHADFGRAIYPEWDSRFGQGVPTTETTYMPFVYLNSGTPAVDSAEEWQPTDDEVIGTGPFEFDTFSTEQSLATVLKYPLYFTGVDWKTGDVVDSFVKTYIHQPYIGGITFPVYPTLTLGVLALKSGVIDYLHAPIPPEFIPELQTNPNIGLWFGPDPGFTYLAYNMRRPATGLWHWGQADQFDIGYHFRKAVAHLIDKATIVNGFLSGYGVPGKVPVSPFNKKFYNDSISGYAFSRTEAENELALAHQDALWLAGHGEPAAASWYSKNPGTGKYILPSIGTSQFNMWCPNADYDPVKANSCVAIATEMQMIGINVVARPASFGALTAMITAHDFDMYIKDWELRTNDPDYLCAFFHSSNAASGRNYPGFNDVLSDWVLDASRKELDEDARISLLKWEQGIIADKLPYDTLYFRTMIEAQRRDRFVGWNQSYGKIWNSWSLMNIRPPSTMGLFVSIEAPSAVASDSSTDIVVVVKDRDGAPVSGATVTLRLLPESLGNFTYGGSPPNSTYTNTTSLGLMTVTYLAPSTTAVANVTLIASATHPDYPDSSDTAVVTIFPSGVNFLSIMIAVLDMDVMPPLGSARLGIKVTTPQGLTKDDAEVVVSLYQPLDPPYGVVPSYGTAAQLAEVTFRAPHSTLLPYTMNSFVVTADATSPGYLPGSASVGLSVVKTHTPPEASFTVIPPEGPASTIFEFDSTASFDPEELPSDLQVRWDWENDSFWDTVWSPQKTENHQFAVPGIYTVRLQVRDSEGLTDNATGQVAVSAIVENAGFPWLVVIIPLILVVTILAIVVFALLRRKKRPMGPQGP